MPAIDELAETLLQKEEGILGEGNVETEHATEELGPQLLFQNLSHPSALENLSSSSFSTDFADNIRPSLVDTDSSNTATLASSNHKIVTESALQMLSTAVTAVQSEIPKMRSSESDTSPYSDILLERKSVLEDEPCSYNDTLIRETVDIRASLLPEWKSLTEKMRLLFGDKEKDEKTLQSTRFETEYDYPIPTFDWGSFTCKYKPKSLAQGMKAVLAEEAEADALIAVGEKTFQCHSILLDVYTTKLQDAPWKEPLKIPRYLISSEMFELVYGWMLHSHTKIKTKNLIECLTAAEKLGIDDLAAECWAYLDHNQLYTEICSFGFYIQAVKFENPRLQQLCLSRVRKCALTVIASKEFLDMAADNVMFFLSQGALRVNHEIEIFFAIVLWLNHNWDDREQHIRKVMSAVHLHYLPVEFLDTLIRKSSAFSLEVQRVVNNPKFNQMLHLELAYRAAGNENKLIPPPRDWCADKQCPYISLLKDNLVNITFQMFKKYLQLIGCYKLLYWEQLVPVAETQRLEGEKKKMI